MPACAPGATITRLTVTAISRLISDFSVRSRVHVDADLAAGDGGTESISDPLTELADSRFILRRALFGWIAVIAVIVIGGWAA